LTAFDQNAVVTSANASAQTITIPAESVVNYPLGTQITIIQTGAGAVTLAKTGSDTIVPATSNTAAAGDTLILTKTSSSGGVAGWHCGVAVAA
jgi:hypothetical protein